MKKNLVCESAPKAIGPYSVAVEYNGLIFVSGQIALEPKTGQIVEGGVAEQAHQVMKNISAILGDLGLSFANVLKSSIFLKRMSDFAEVNEIYGSYFTDSFPARETVEVSCLPKDVAIEISVIIGR